jgi:hypothetical protein
MKKTSFIIPAAIALTLASCGGGTTQQTNVAAPDTAANVAAPDTAANCCRDTINHVSTTTAYDDTTTAYQIFKLIDPKNASIKLEADDDTTSKDKFSCGVNMTDYNEGEEVYCLSHSDGGRLVIHQEWIYTMDGSSANIKNIYLYQDGKLTKRNDLLPKVSNNEIAAIYPVSLYNATADFKKQLTTSKLHKEYDSEDSPNLLKYYKWVFYNCLKICFKWDGSKFVSETVNRNNDKYDLLSSAGIGKIFIGDNPPDNIAGFQKKTEGKAVVFSRDGKKHFRLSLSDDGKIDTITILSDRYTYHIERMGDNGLEIKHYGIGSSDIGYEMLSSQYFVIKDGVWVRTIEGANDINLAEMFGEYSDNPADYPRNGVIEFYTTKNAITNIYPEIGKKVDDNDNPKYDAKAKVTLIKIYRRQADDNEGDEVDE